MPIGCRIHPGTYFDSVMLMRVAAELSGMAGVRTASLIMGTPANKAVLADAGLLTSQAGDAGPNDLVVVVDADEAGLQAALARAEERLTVARERQLGGQVAEAAAPVAVRTLAQAAGGADLAMISVPGQYAASEALKALRLGLHVFLFSDNVPVEDEVLLKEQADHQGLLVMGPDCGTAVVGGRPLGFANRLRPGRVGLAGASGTGLQQVAVLLDRWGAGVSHVLGTGSRDLAAEVSGRSTRRALHMLAGDADTDVIVLVAKPPAAAVASQLLDQAAAVGKPVVACFLGSELAPPGGAVTVAATLEDAARAAARLTGVTPPPAPAPGAAAQHAAGLAPSRRLLRGLYSGGTFAYEAQAVLGRTAGPVASGMPAASPTQPARFPGQHTVLDLGADQFTIGRPHPMIDPSVRTGYLRAALADPATAVIVLDVVIGYGSAPDPAASLAEELEQADRTAGPAVIGFVVGTEEDPQHRTAQEQRLEKAGVAVAGNSTAAARLAAAILAARRVGE